MKGDVYMVYAKIHCGNCNRKWLVYWRDANSSESKVCPHCGKEIDDDLWDHDVKHAMASVVDTNMELQRYADGYNRTRFRVEYIG